MNSSAVQSAPVRISLDFLPVLRCPHTRSELRELSLIELDQLNRSISQRELFHYEGSEVERPITQGLSSADGRYVYRIEQGVIVLLKNLAMVKAANLAPEQERSGLMKEKRDVQHFYDSFGWMRTDGENFKDGDIYEDRRPVSQPYINRCHRRVKEYVRPSGEYLLDAASGPIQYDIYLEYSENYRYRICVDLSFVALQHARQKLGDRGIYLVADIANLPIQDNSIDAVLSLNTIYHIPASDQVPAMQELYRVLAPGASGVVVYSLGRRSTLNNLLALPTKVWIKLNSLIRTRLPQSMRTRPELYFHAHPRGYFSRERIGFSMQLACWRLLSVHTMKYYFHKYLGGEALYRFVYWLESKYPQTCGKIGEYPMFYFVKR